MSQKTIKNIKKFVVAIILISTVLLISFALLKPKTFLNNSANNSQTTKLTNVKEIKRYSNINYDTTDDEGYYIAEAGSIYEFLESSDIRDGYYKLTVNDETYNIHMYTFNGNQNWTTNQTFGDANDVGKSSGYAKNSVMVKINGDLTVAAGVTVTAYSTEYGGPKGLFLYATGKLTNNGTITMSKKGGAGGEKSTTGGVTNPGENGTGRATGGGASGRAYSSYVGTAGSSGTSYSGGSGGAYYISSSLGETEKYKGQPNGGAGGSAYSNSASRPGAGNPAGTPYSSSSDSYKAENGTGGLLTIYSGSYENNGEISATGANSRLNASASTTYDYGGASGGGSINIFTKSIDVSYIGTDYEQITKLVLGNLSANGGIYKNTSAGIKSYAASGTINEGIILENGSYGLIEEYVKDKVIINNVSRTISGESILDIISRNDLQTGYYYFDVNGISYMQHVYVLDGNQVFDENKIFGDNYDVGAEDEYAKAGVIVKVKGDLTINSGVTVSPYSTEYGGPKGFFVYATGTLTNNGEISVSKKGAKAPGEKVYLWKNAKDSTYEYVPEKSTSDYRIKWFEGRATASGDSAYVSNVSYNYNKGDGALGTSYSGGTGGAYKPLTDSVADENGGKGQDTDLGCSGAGNPSGNTNYPRPEYSKAENGTGGLLTIYADTYINKGTLSATGADGIVDSSCSSGGSGGGSINVFIGNIENTMNVLNTNNPNTISGNTNAKNGKKYNGSVLAGNINVGAIIDGTYYGIKNAITYTLSKDNVIEGKSIYDILKNNSFENDKYYQFKVKDETYIQHVYNVDGNLSISSNTKYGATLDVATKSEMASAGIVLKVNGNLTNNSSIDVYNEDFGGPKGLFVFTSGNITGSGSINNIHGAYAKGQNVYLYENYDGTMEYVPAKGSKGGEPPTVSAESTSEIYGEAEEPIGRQTSGGASGPFKNNYQATRGGEGTSYSGGVGGGVIKSSIEITDDWLASNDGGRAGIQTFNTGSYSIGNPVVQGEGKIVTGYWFSTSGLLVVYANNVASTISYKATPQMHPGAQNSFYSGPAGGGSINEFTSTCKIEDEIKTYTIEQLQNRYNKGVILQNCSNTPTNVKGGHSRGSTNVFFNPGTATKQIIDLNYNKSVSKEDYVEQIYIDELKSRTMPFLNTLTTSAGTWNKEFNSQINEYKITIPSDVLEVTIDGTTKAEDQIAEGFGTFKIPVGTTEKEIVVTMGEYTNTYKLIFERKGDSNKYLNGITIDGTLIENFNSEKLEYTLNYSGTKQNISIDVIKGHANQTVKGTGEFNLPVGLTTKYIDVESEDKTGTTRYTININRTDSSKYLSNLNVVQYGINETFNKEVNNYTLTVPGSVSSINITATLEDSNSSLSGTGTKSLSVGENVFNIIVTTAGGLTNTYTLTVTKEDSSIYLNSLSADGYEFDSPFDKEVNNYTLTVENEVKNITILATLEDNVSQVNGTGIKTLSVGKNTFNIIVTSLNGKTNTYTIVINRLASSNANIKNITSTLGEITKEDNTTYKMYVAKGTPIIYKNDLVVETESEGATVERAESINLSETREYLITVTSENGLNTKEYKVIIEYKLSSDYRLSTMIVSGRINPAFDKDIFEYDVHIFDTDNELSVEAYVNEENAIILNDSLTFTIDSEEKVIEILTQAEDGSLGIYKLNVLKDLTREKYLQNIEVTKVLDYCEDCIIPEFNSETYEYEMTVPYEVKSVGFEITKKHKSQVVLINNAEKLTEYVLRTGENIFEITVQNSDNEITTYVYKVNRLKNTNNYLKELKLESPNIDIPNYDREVNEYTVSLESENESVVVKAIPEDENATVKISGNNNLVTGNNDVLIVVTAENGDERVYILHVLRMPSSNNLLSNLQVLGDSKEYSLTPKFQSGINNYSLTVDGTEKVVTVFGTKSDPEAVVEGNNDYSLKVGSNKIEIKVTSASGEENIYTITITRLSLKYTELSKLNVLNGQMSPEFNESVLSYDVLVDNTVDQLDLEIETKDPDASYEVIGNSKLSPGKNIVKVIVNNSDKSAYKIYNLNVNKVGSDNNYLSSISVDGNRIEEFNKDINEYSLEVDYDVNKTQISVTTEDSKATVSGTGLHSLSEGNNIIDITVTAESGAIRIYRVNITRRPNLYLSAIITDLYDTELNFDKFINKYEIEVENDVEDVTIYSIAESNSSEVTGNGTYDLLVGENIINLVVSNGDLANTYEIVINRKGSNNTYLKYLTVGEGILSPVFSKSETEYTVNITNDKTSITLDYEPEDASSSVEVIGNENFTEESNEVIVRVTSTLGNVRDYKITVIREDENLYSNKLIDLTVSEGTLSPTFDPDTSQYLVTVDSNVSSININAVRESIAATVVGTGSHNLVVGRNTIQILVLSKDNKSRIYTVIVYRKEASDARLSELEFNGGYLSPSFSKNIYEYTLITNADTKFVTAKVVKPVLENATYTVTIPMEEVKTGNQILVEVTSPDKKQTKTYVVTLEVKKSTNSYLKNLSVNMGELDKTFDKTTYAYMTTVESDVNSVIVSAEPESSKATVTGTGVHELEPGNNYINIIVLSESGNTSTYSLIVVKKKSSNTNLRDLQVKGYSLDKTFDPSETTYNVEVENDTDSVIIEAVKEEENQEIAGVGEAKLEVGTNVINVYVTAEDGSTKIYTINVTRKKKTSSKIKSLSIVEGVINPEFSSENYEYSITIPNEYTSITPVIELVDTEASYEITGNENFNVGNNEVKILVRSSNGEESTYIINVIRSVSSNNYLSRLVVDNGTLTPAFDKNILNYTVILPNEESEITILGIAESSTTTVEGNGKYTLVNLETELVINAISSTGVTRSYKVKVIREANANNDLASLSVSEGELNPTFNNEITNYEVEVPAGTDKIEVFAEALVASSVVSGLGEYAVEVGENTINVNVTSESGEIKTYTIKVIRNRDNNTNIVNIVPSTGELSPSFNNDISEYEITVSSTTNIINFEVLLESKDASVSGNKDILVIGKETIADIVITAEDGTQRVVKVKIIKESSVRDIILEEINILLPEEEEYQIKPIIDPDDAVNKNLIYTSSDPTVASVNEEGIVRALSIGTAEIIIKSEDNENIETTLTVTVVHRKIKSNVYDISDKDTERIIIGMNEGITLKDFVDNLINDQQMIKIYDKDGNLLTDMNEIVKTGLVVKLEINDKVFDTVVMIVRGDINEDGIIDVSDKVKLVNYILKKIDSLN